MLAAGAQAIVNPNFTPRDLVDEVQFAFAGPVAAGDDAVHWRMTAAETLKGEPPAAHELSLAACNKDHLAAIQAALARSGKTPAILFAGLAGSGTGCLHVADEWIALKAAGAGKWDVLGAASNMSGTFAGSTEKLIRMARHLVADPDEDVPIAAGVRWLDSSLVAAVEGRIAGLAAVDFGPGGKTHLFLASPAGDRLFRQKGDEDELEDVTGTTKLVARSRRFAWLDVDLDGRADLVTWDGEAVSVRLSNADGTFRDGGEPWTAKLGGECLSICPAAVGAKAAVVIGTAGTPRILVAAAAGWQAAAVPEAADAANLGPATACVVADFDSDGRPDILQAHDQGGLLWRGTADGFAAPAASAVKVAGPAVAVVADFDADGSLDVLLCGPRANGLWQNDGAAGFRDVLRGCGSLSYKFPAAASAAAAMDLNHDARVDLCLGYPAADLLYHWNRGFGAMAEEGEVRLSASVPEPGQPAPGQCALAAGDFNNDASADLAVALADGRVYCYFNDRMDKPAVQLRLPKGVAGCVTASIWTTGKSAYCLRAATVASHSPAAYLPVRYPGEVTVRWTAAGKAQSKTVEVENETTDVELAAGK